MALTPIAANSPGENISAGQTAFDPEPVDDRVDRDGMAAQLNCARLAPFGGKHFGHDRFHLVAKAE